MSRQDTDDYDHDEDSSPPSSPRHCLPVYHEVHTIHGPLTVSQNENESDIHNNSGVAIPYLPPAPPPRSHVVRTARRPVPKPHPESSSSFNFKSHSSSGQTRTVQQRESKKEAPRATAHGLRVNQTVIGEDSFMIFASSQSANGVESAGSVSLVEMGAWVTAEKRAVPGIKDFSQLEV